jgi:hypothetical protein
MAKRGSAPRTPSHDQIAAEAYKLYLQNGCQPGHELDDWLRAEQLVNQGNGNGNKGSKGAAHSGSESGSTLGR